MVITSQDNAKIAEVRKLFDKKQRKQLGKYVIEGERLLKDAIAHDARVCYVLVKNSVADKYNFDNQLLVQDNVFDKISDTVNSQGVIAVVEQQDFPLEKPVGNSLILDCVQDPGNVGTLIRTAVACGFTNIYAVNSVDLFSPKVVRSAMSAHFCVKLCQTNSMQSVFDCLQGVTKLCADMSGESLFENTNFGKVAVIVGNEGNGVSDYSVQNCDKVISLPMENNFESLNVSVAGSVIMYHIYSHSK